MSILDTKIDTESHATAASGSSLRALPSAFVRALLVFGGIAPFVPAWTEGVPRLAWLGRGLDAWFSLQCHREAARSFAPAAVCTRCLGIYVGLALGALVARPRLAPKRHVLVMLVAAALLALDVLTEAFGVRPPSAPLRFVTGFALAYPAAVSVVSALRVRTGTRATARTRCRSPEACT